MRLFFSFLMASLIWASATTAKAQDSVFRDYDDYAAFVDRQIMQRDFIPLIQRLGGRDEFSSEQLIKLQGQFMNAWRENFQNVSVFRQTDLGGGVMQEGRIYWTGTSYGFFFATLHRRDDAFVVVHFKLNTEIDPIMGSF